MVVCSVTEKKESLYKTYRIEMLRYLLISLTLIFSETFAIASQNQPINTRNPVTALSGFGVNSMALWGGGSKTNPRQKSEFLSHYRPLEDFGITHVVLVSCADWIIDISCKKDFQNLDGIITAAEILLNDTNLHIVIQLKAYKKTKVQGKNISELNQRLETDSLAVKKFVESWGVIAKELADYQGERLSFNLLNEPEFQIPKPTKQRRDKWLNIAQQAAKKIRSETPERPIIIEGIAKSLFARRLGNGNGYEYENPDELLTPINMDNIIYAFHNYEPEEFLQQSLERFGSFGRPYIEKYSDMVRLDAERAANWSDKHEVPVMLTETGCIGFLKKIEGPKSNKDCGLFAEDIQENYIDRGIGVTWWALEKEKTIYNRDCSDNCWMPLRGSRPNAAIFNAFGLKIPKFEPIPLSKIKINELLKYDADFESCVKNEAKTLGISEAKISKTIKKAKSGKEKHIQKIKDLIVGGSCL